MIIRSQDKKTITNFSQLTDLSIHPNHDYSAFRIVACYPFALGEDYSSMQIGTYSTEEKAIKVLDMIQDAYMQYGTFKDGIGNIHGVFNFPKCFQMPQDSEV